MLTALLLLTIAGCGGKGGGSSSSKGAERSVLNPSTVVVPSEAIPTITETGVVLPAGTSVPAVGSALVWDGPGTQGFVRKVAAASVGTDGTVEVTTEQATLLDVFKEAKFDRDIAISAETLAGLEPAEEGITISPLPRSRAENPLTTQISVDKELESSGVKARLKGNLKLAVGVRTALDIRTKGWLNPLPAVWEFRAAPNFRLDGDLTLSAEGAFEYKRRIPVSLPFSFPLPPLGPVPVNGKLQMFLELEGKLAGRGQIKVTGKLFVEGGVECVQDQWGLVKRFEPSFTVEPPKAYAQGLIRVSAAQPEFALEIPGIGSVGAASDVMRAMVAMTYRTNPRPAGFVVSSRADFSMKATATIKLGPVTVHDGPFAEFSFGAYDLLAPFFIPDTKSRIIFSSDKYVYQTDPNLQESILFAELYDEHRPSSVRLTFNGQRSYALAQHFQSSTPFVFEVQTGTISERDLGSAQAFALHPAADKRLCTVGPIIDPDVALDIDWREDGGHTYARYTLQDADPLKGGAMKVGEFDPEGERFITVLLKGGHAWALFYDVPQVAENKNLYPVSRVDLGTVSVVTGASWHPEGGHVLVTLGDKLVKVTPTGWEEFVKGPWYDARYSPDGTQILGVETYFAGMPGYRLMAADFDGKNIRFGAKQNLPIKGVDWRLDQP